MPGHEALVARLLDEEACAPHQNIRANEALHGVENVGVAHNLVDPGEQQIAFGTQPAGRQACRRLDGLEPLPVVLSVLAREHADRREITVLRVLAHILRRQCHRSFFHHTGPPHPLNCLGAARGLTMAR
jgi:hypothetical protein